MLIPEDGSLQPITRSGFTPFNNVMVVKISKNREEKAKTIYNLVTLDSSKKGERWPTENCCEETSEIIKDSTVPELTKSEIDSANMKKFNINVKSKQRSITGRKAIQRRQRNINKQKFVKKNVPKETRNHHNTPIDEIDPWLPRTALPMDAHILSQMQNETFPNSYNLFLLENKGLLGNGPEDMMNNISMISTLQNRLSRNSVPTSLPISENHSNREIPSINNTFANAYHTDFRNKPLRNNKYDRRYNDSYSNNSVLPKYIGSYNIAEREKSPNNPLFINRFEPQVGSSYETNYKTNTGDPDFRNCSYDNFNVPLINDLPEDTFSRSGRTDHPCKEIFIGTERDFQACPRDDGLISYRKSHPPNTFVRDCTPETFNGTNGACYGKDTAYSAGYNEMPRNSFREFNSFRNNFRNSGDQPKTNMIENSFMGTNLDFSNNHRLSEGNSPLNKSYENYADVCRGNQTNFYEQYENDRTWNNGCKLNSSFHGNYSRNRNQFRSKNKKSWKNGSFKNFQQNKLLKGRNNHRFEKKKS